MLPQNLTTMTQQEFAALPPQIQRLVQVSRPDLEVPQTPGPEAICLQTPLYVELPPPSPSRAIELRANDHHFDAYCVGCGRSSTMHAIDRLQVQNGGRGHPNQLWLGTWCLRYACTRDANHRMEFWFLGTDKSVTKIGQHPSMADLAEGDLSRYRDVISRSDLAELKRAIGLASHGIGVGSFVYLRRIIERMIRATFDSAPNMPTAEEFDRLRIDERMRLLKDHLPSFLADNTSIYGIVSKGIHELSEDDCLGAFPVLRLAIEQVLDDKLAERSAAKKRDEVAKAINAMNAQHSAK